MSRVLPQHTIDAQVPELRQASKVNDLEARLATLEGSDAIKRILALEATDALPVPGASVSAATDFTSPAGDYTPPVGSYGLCGWYATIVVGPNQSWDVWASVQVANNSVASWVRTNARMAFRDSTGAVGPTGVALVGAAPEIMYSHSGGVAQRSLNPRAILTTTGAVAANTTVRLYVEFNNPSAAGGYVPRDGTYYRIAARRGA